jgi:hypothetical protein
MALINRGERSRPDETHETADDDAESGRGRRRLLLLSGLAAVGAGAVALRRRWRRSKREFVEIELDGETAEQ